jgi:preprotein translocase subunit SecG
MQTFLIVLHVILCAFLVLLVLIQSGRGAELSSTLSGSSQSILGASGGSNFFTKLTGIFAALFMLTSILLTIHANKSRKSVVEGMDLSSIPATSLSVSPTPSVAPETQASEKK